MTSIEHNFRLTIFVIIIDNFNKILLSVLRIGKHSCVLGLLDKLLIFFKEK